MSEAVQILIVEDEPALLPILARALEESGYAVMTVPTGGEGANELRSGQYALAIVDLMLPGIDGFQLIARVREAGIDTPILVLSARNRVEDKIRALDLGADDYLPKPFKTLELVARIRALLRRSKSSAQPIQVADLVLDPEMRTVRRSGRTISLSQKEYALLELLMRHPGSPVSKATILRQVWSGKQLETDNVVEVYIGYLRQKTEEGGMDRLIVTVRGFGYAIRETSVA